MSVELLSVEPIGESTTWDIANFAEDVADGQGNFAIGGLVVHNSIPEAVANRADTQGAWKKPLADIHPGLLKILESTYGVICYQEDTLISLADGRELPIRDVAAGQLVHSMNPDTLEIGVKPVQTCIPTLRTDGLRITLDNGYSVIVTDSHRIWAWGGLREADKLAIGDLVAVPARLSVSGTQPNFGAWLGGDDSVAYLLGQLTGDGMTSGSSSTLVVGDSEATADRLATWITANTKLLCNKFFHCRSWYLGLSHPEQEPVSVELPPYEDTRRWWSHAYSSYGGDRIAKHIGRSTWYAYDRIRAHCVVSGVRKHARRSRWQSFLRRHGMKVNLYNKRVPPAIMTAVESVRLHYLAGMIDSDGTISSAGTCHITTESPLLLEDLRKLAAGLGVAHHLAHNRIYLWDTIRLKTRLGDKLIVKSFDGKPLSSGADCGWAPRTDAVRSALCRFGSLRMCERVTGVDRKCLSSHDSRYVHTSTAVRVGLDLGDARFHKVVSVERVYDQQFYDLAVADYHILVANGIIASNCYQEQLAAVWQLMAGFTSPEAQDARKAVAKKWKHLLKPIEARWMAGAVKTMGEKAAAEWWAKMVTFGRYAFNKCIDGSTYLTDTVTGERHTVQDWYDAGRHPDRLAAWDGGLATDECVAIHENQPQEILEVEFDDGSVERLTAGHRLLCTDGEYHTVAEIFDRGLDVSNARAGGDNHTPLVEPACDHDMPRLP